jgi:glycosyltransferase involved in cell wall biosynthesis
MRFVWRRIALPLVGVLPKHRQMQVRTLAHHTKMTLAHGEVIDFDRSGNAGGLSSGRTSETGAFPAISGSAGSPFLPPWLVAELQSLSTIEPDLFPTPDFRQRFVAYTSPMELGPGQTYAACCRIIGDLRPGIIFLVPWLVRGGADQGVLHHVTAALAAGKRPLLIATVDRESPWKSRLPEQVRLIELGALARGLSESQKLSVLTRIVLQSPSEVIHIVNCPLGWEMVRQHGRSLLAVDKRVFASVFCDDYDYHGALHSYAQMYFVDCWKFLRGVICDTCWYPQDLVRQYGVSLDKVRTVYFPVCIDHLPTYKAVSKARVLWVGRFTKQKRVDLLVEVARLLPEVVFDVYGYAVHDYERELERVMRSVQNIGVHGQFDSMASVVAENTYSLLLYTSGWDGLPITLLDATIAGLPVVASAVGGIPEFISEETGYPVWDPDEPKQYVKRIHEAMADDFGRRRKWAAAVELVLSRHTVGNFSQQLNRISGYFGSE